MNFDAIDTELKATEDKIDTFRFILDEILEKHNELQAM